MSERYDQWGADDMGGDDDYEQKPSRRLEKSLGILTTKFVRLLQEAPDGMLDLKSAADMLAVRQKRRIYDITNVLEGIGLIEKNSKNLIRWRGSGPRSNSSEVSGQLDRLRQEMEQLMEWERLIDDHERIIQHSLKSLAETLTSANLAYVTHSDVRSLELFHDKTVIAIKAPSGAKLNVPEPQLDEQGQFHHYNMYLHSDRGPIEAFLVCEAEAAGAAEGPQVPQQPTLQEVDAAAGPSAATITAAARAAETSADPSLGKRRRLSGEGASFYSTNLVRLSPPPLDEGYIFNLEPTEGVADLYNLTEQSDTTTNLICQ
eukprot:m.189716 g.189716  ORF g.189716 m.189716 type:complete len:317 (+) comp17552_c2_seq1:399-1349(+)